MALQYIEEKGKTFDIVEYLKDIPTSESLVNILNQLGMEPESLLRKNEADFKEHFKGKELSKAEWVEAMRSYPKLIERPIVIKGKRAVIARPTEKIDELD
jgi:arsenate reductase